ATAAGGAATLFFTRPGTEPGMGEDPEVDDAVADAINQAEFTVDLCLYEFKRELVYQAAVNAALRGVQVRFVGDGDEIEDTGYQALAQAGVQLVVRPPKQRIMHNKFAVIDARRVFTGSMNYTDTGMLMNNNHTVLLESPDAADLYAEEFQQMYDLALFGPGKEPVIHPRQFNLGDRPVEVYFSPEDRPIEQLRRALSTADHSVYFMIFSFTDTDVAADLEALHAQGVEVVGVFDESQARGRYSVDERLAQAGLPVFIDGNNNADGFAGGKLHHKVMLIDVGTDSDPIVVSGSFNWSNAANLYNDENLVIYRGADFALPFLEEFCAVLEVATPHPEYLLEVPDPCAALRVSVRINEVLPNPEGTDGPEEFVELVNAGPSPMDLAGWTLGDLTSPERHVFDSVVLQPGASIVVYGGPNEAEPDRRVASAGGGLSLNNSSETITLRDATGTVIDQISWANAASGVAFNRSPDGATDGDVVVPHTDLGAAAMSPGRRVDGSLWPGQPMIVINELLPNPDGTDAGEEYIELVNAGTGVVDLSGWTLGDALEVRHIFDGPRLAPGDVLVLFDKGEHADVPNALVSSTGSLSLNNTGDTVTLTDVHGVVHTQVEYGSAVSGMAFNQSTDGQRTGMLVFHSLVEGAAGNLSPGRRADGGLWIPPPPMLKVVINELLPDPAGTDTGSEYVELVNVGDADIDLAGYSLGDATSNDRHVFAGGSVLPVGQALVIFDKGEHAEVPGAINSSSGSLSLNNTGDQITLYRPDGTVMDGVAYDSAREGVALTRSADADPLTVLVDHDTAQGAVGYKSPGLRNDGSPW
ncbi:MAG: lamin tail domain-containing protein, partial [Myxococcales bacterium]|nr:lamin tail domain-containing protein [Myxococcales bacterium]